MKELNALRVIQALGGALSLAMMLLLACVAATDSTHLVWAGLCGAGVVVFAGARWLDEHR